MNNKIELEIYPTLYQRNYYYHAQRGEYQSCVWTDEVGEENIGRFPLMKDPGRDAMDKLRSNYVREGWWDKKSIEEVFMYSK